ncbi:hypothetical protein [Streptomyces europaeiscabiei]|uniref:hypothetical protein n=1 Tax=Streptomyces europaeiscabiei TaxID=146819 RepID=UPI002E2BF4C3|nr:hypothetical protein [Streptomyces europaeiscabiei]
MAYDAVPVNMTWPSTWMQPGSGADRLALASARGTLLPFPDADQVGPKVREFGDDTGGSGGAAAGCRHAPQARSADVPPRVRASCS